MGISQLVMNILMLSLPELNLFDNNKILNTVDKNARPDIINFATRLLIFLLMWKVVSLLATIINLQNA